MTKTIEYAKSIGLKYVYLGSLQRPGDVYKLQFEGIEWFDGKEWKKDTKQIKDLLNNLQ
jgi:arginyl-tRNA--protein-N-Asp/Glu arginylyltransferase